MDFFETKPRPARGQSARIKQWMTDYGTVPESATIMVTELACREPGCPPLETVVAVLEGGHQWKTTLHKAIDEVSEEDVRAIAQRWATRGEPGVAP